MVGFPREGHILPSIPIAFCWCFLIVLCNYPSNNNCAQSVPHSIEQPSSFIYSEADKAKHNESSNSCDRMESYLKPVTSGTAKSWRGTRWRNTEAATAQSPSDLKMVLEKMERMEPLEAQLRELEQPAARAPGRGWGRRRAGRSEPRNCWNYGGEDHLSHECPSV